MSKRNAKRAAKAAQKHPALVAAIVIILALIIVAVAALWYFRPDIFNNLFGVEQSGEIDGDTSGGGNNNGGNNGGGDGGGSPNAPSAGAQGEIAEAGFSIHFLELGNGYAGDCILIDCGDTEVLIDAGSRQSSATAIKQYLDKYCTDGTIEYVISTHADQDHIAAYVGNSSNGSRTGILYQYNVGTLIKFDRTGKTTQIYNNYLAAVAQAQEKGTAVYTASQCYYQTDGALRQYYLDEERTLSINILYNYYYEHSSSDENNYSVVALLTKELPEGNKHYLFTGDLEKDGEERLVAYYANPANSQSVFDILPEVELYKAGHHGSRTSSNAVLIDVIKPKYVAVCCVAGAPEYTKNNLNTFPTQAMIDNVSKYTDKIYVTSLATDLPELNGGLSGQFVSDNYGYTSMNGDIVFYWSGGELKLWCSNNTTILKDTEWFKKYRS